MVSSPFQIRNLPSPQPARCPDLEFLSSPHIAAGSSIWRKLLMQAETAAPHVQVAAIEGENGAGKQTLARHLFAHSRYALSSFRRLDAEEWLHRASDLSLLAGFTYLDRVDLLPIPGQEILLRALKCLQDHTALRFLLVASSETGLRELALQGHFLPDLVFRLNAVRFTIPPLRMRREDIAPLSQCLLTRICARYQLRPVHLGPGSLDRLLEYSWPGNIRELSSVLESALLESSDGVIRPADLDLREPCERPPVVIAPLPPDNLELDQAIQRHAQYVLDLNRGNKLRAAQQLRISRSTLYRILGHDAHQLHQELTRDPTLRPRPQMLP